MNATEKSGNLYCWLFDHFGVIDTDEQQLIQALAGRQAAKQEDTQEAMRQSYALNCGKYVACLYCLSTVVD